MVKIVSVLILALWVVAPAWAQDDDYPRIETTFAYSNTSLSIQGFTGQPDLFSGNHSGFANISGLNLFPWMGIENYMGYYGLGDGFSLFQNTFGGRLTARNFERIVPYVGAGIGVGYFTVSGSSLGGSNLATRISGGVDLPINETLSWKFDVTRLTVRTADFRTAGISPDGWSSGTTFTTGIILNIGQ